MNPEILVVVGGITGSGKTTVAQIIETALQSHGIQTTLVDDTKEEILNDPEMKQKRISALKSRNAHVRICSKQLKRPPKC